MENKDILDTIGDLSELDEIYNLITQTAATDEIQTDREQIIKDIDALFQEATEWLTQTEQTH